MTRLSAPPRSALPGVSLLLGGLSILVVVIAVLWLSTFYAEAVFGPMGVAGAVIVLVSGAGIWVAAVALRRRARPRWMPVVGLVASILALLPGLYFAVGLVAVMMYLATSPLAIAA